MKYGYARVSSVGQDLETQINTLKEEGCQEIYSEKFTGTKKERPKFQELLSKAEEGDTIVVTKLDRFARSTIHGAQIVQNLLNKGVKVNILNIGVMDNTPSSKLIRNIFFAFSEFERDMIVERTQEGKAIAKKSDDFREGRPNVYSKKQIDHALELLETHTYKQVEEKLKISKSTLIRAKRKR